MQDVVEVRPRAERLNPSEERLWEGREFDEPRSRGTLWTGAAITRAGSLVNLQRYMEASRRIESEGKWVLGAEWHAVDFHRRDSRDTAENLRHRLANANDYFHRKASEVFNDVAALELLDTMDRDVVVDISDFNFCEDGLPLAKLTAANFCEVGATVIHITEAGQRFIESLRSNGRI